MPTYEYVCKSCGNRFELFRSMNDDSKVKCSNCSGETVKAVVTTGGIIMKNDAGCSFESTGTTCCGARQKCGNSSCGG